jgi:predicted MFS family arabinose efflux permease
VPQLFEADVAQAYPGDEAIVAGRHHRGQLVIEACADAAVTGQPEVDRGELADAQAAQVVLDALTQLVRFVEREDGTATWSLGGVLASIAGARTISWGWPIAPTFTVIAVLAAATSFLAAPALLANEAAATGAPRPATAPKPRVPQGVWALATVAMMVMLCEGVAYDWSTVHLRTVIHASAATSALAYGAYATAATVGRLIADRLAARIGPVVLFRSGATLAGLGMVTVVLSHQATLAIAAWAAVGLGLSGCIPQLFTAAGGLDRDAAGANVARVAGLGYLGMLAGPAIIGPLTRLMALNLALVLPAALCFAAAYAAYVLRPAPQPAERPARQPLSADRRPAGASAP